MHRARRTERKAKTFCDLLQQWNTQVNIPAVLETVHKPTHLSGYDIIRYYKKQSLTIQAVQKHRTITDVPIALTLKWLTKKPIWVKQWNLKKEKLQALEQLVQKQLDVQYIY